jgi:hypothetical protein
MSAGLDVRTKWQAKREASYAALVRSAMRCFHEARLRGLDEETVQPAFIDGLVRILR